MQHGQEPKVVYTYREVGTQGVMERPDNSGGKSENAIYGDLSANTG